MKKHYYTDTNIPFKNENFQKILTFYLFNSPCEISKGTKENKTYIPVSKVDKTFSKQGWTDTNLSTLIAKMKSMSYHLEYYPISSNQSINTIEKNISLSDPNFEMIIMHTRSDMSKACAIFYYIRNGFAHGSFNVKNNIYCFESSKNGITKAKIRLKEETLLKWIDCFYESPKKHKSKSYEKKNKIKKRKKELVTT